MKHIDIKAYLEAATASEDAWNVCNDKLLELEVKLTEANQIKAQIKLLLDNVSMASSHLRSLVMDLENYYGCMCGKLEDHPIHDSLDSYDNLESHYKDAHIYTKKHELRSKDYNERY